MGRAFSGATTPTLSLSNVFATGDYSVAVSNSVGARFSDSATLVVISPASGGVTNTYWDQQSGNNNWSQAGTSGNWLDYSSPQGTGYYPNGSNYSVTLDGVGGTVANLNVNVTLGSLTILNNGGLNIQEGLTLTVSNLDFHGDSGITVSGCCSPENLILNGGTLSKSAGTNTSTIGPSIVLTSVDSTLAVDSGTLALPGNNSYYTNGFFSVASNATLALVPAGYVATFAGAFSGSGSGTVLLSSGTLNSSGATFDVPGSLFQWTGGSIAGTITNQGVMTFAGTGGRTLAGSGSQFFNAGLVNQSGSGPLNLDRSGSGTFFNNLPGATYQLSTDSSVTPVNCCGTFQFNNQGLFWKSGGTNVSTVGVVFNDSGGEIRVDSGELVFNAGGSSSDGNFDVASGASLDLTGGNNPSWTGTMGGSGGGQVLLSSGTVNGAGGLTLEFTNDMFQWSGGSLSGAITNNGTVVLSGPNYSTLASSGSQFINAGLFKHEGAGGLALDRSGSGTIFDNLSTGTYEFFTDSAIFPINCCGVYQFDNQGLLWKSGGTNISNVEVTYNNQGGRIRVDSGEIVLSAGGSSSNGTFNVASSAILDLTGGSSPTWAGLLTGSGGGQVLLGTGTIHANPSLALAFVDLTFQWSGGNLSGTITNDGVVVLSGASDSALVGSGSRFFNAGTVKHEGSGRLSLDRSGSGTAFENLPGGVYEFLADSSLFPVNCCGIYDFDNQGLLWKSGGTNTTTISLAFNNLGGQVQVIPVNWCSMAPAPVMMAPSSSLPAPLWTLPEETAPFGPATSPAVAPAICC